MDRKTFGSKAMAAAVAAVAAAIGCIGPAHAQGFKATGNTDPDHRARPYAQGEVVVTFDTMPTKVSFDFPCFVCQVTENGIRFTCGATETCLVEDGGETVTLQRRTGQTLQVKRSYLSPADRHYLDGLRQRREDQESRLGIHSDKP